MLTSGAVRSPIYHRANTLVVHARDPSTINYSAEELAGEGSSKAAAYKALAAALSVVGVALIFAPQKAIEVAYAAAPTPLLVHLAQMYGAVHVLAFNMASCLADAASHARLNSETYQKLNSGLMLWGVAALIAFTQAPVAAAANAVLYGYGAVLGASVAVPAVCANGFAAKLPKLLPLHIFAASTAYMLGAIATAGFGAFVLLSTLGHPVAISTAWVKAPLGPLGVTMLRLLGSGSILAFFVLITLADAAKRGRLGASTFKALNWATAALTTAILTVAYIGTGLNTVNLSAALPTSLAAVNSWADVVVAAQLLTVPLLAVVSLYQALTAKK